MTETVKRKPDFKGILEVKQAEVVAWVNKDKNGNDYISVKMASDTKVQLNVMLFKNDYKKPSVEIVQ